MNRVTESSLSVTIYDTEILTIIQDMKYIKYCIMMMIVFITRTSGLVPLIEGLSAQILF